MRKSILGLSALSLVALATPAFAQEEAADDSIKITGSVALVSDYRFRGFTQSGQDAAIQGGITATTSSGFYVGTWGSSVSFAGNSEIDLFAGYSTEIGEGLTFDVGVLYYLYPKHGGGATDFFEPYVNLIGTFGPATIKAGINYAWEQAALAGPGGKSDAIYFHLEPTVAIPETPLSIAGHIGYAVSDAFPGGADGEVFDYSLGVNATWNALTFGVSYVGTDEPGSPAGADDAIVFSLTAAF